MGTRENIKGENKLLINSITVNRIGHNIDKIITNYGKYKDTQFIIEQYFKREKQVERHMQVIKPNYIRNNVKVRSTNGKFDSWG